MAQLKIGNAREDLLKWSAVIFSLSFSFGIAVNSIAFFLFASTGILFTVNDLIKGNIQFNFKQFNAILVALFTWIAIREIISDPSEGFNVAFNYLAFLIAPLVIGFQAQKLKSHTPLILKSFLLGCLINAIVNLGFAVYRGVIINAEGINFWYFTYQFLAEPFGIQPIYLGLFYVFALLILVHFQMYKNNKLFYYASFCILSFSIILLAARNAMVCLVILVPLYLVIREKIALKKVLIALGILGGCFVIALQNPVIKNRILKVNKKGNFYSGTSLRAGIWESAYVASKKNWVWGAGETDGSTLLINEYKERELKVPIKYKYHAHSQFLQTLLQYGLLGLLLLLASLFLPGIRTFVQREYLGFFWIVLISLAAITESIFTRQWAVFSFAFFTSLFLLKSSARDTED